MEEIKEIIIQYLPTLVGVATSIGVFIKSCNSLKAVIDKFTNRKLEEQEATQAHLNEQLNKVIQDNIKLKKEMRELINEMSKVKHDD